MAQTRTRQGWIVAIEGASGVGKTTLVGEVARRLPAIPVSEAFVRIRPPPPLTFRSRAQLREIELRLAEEEEERFLDAVRAREGGEVVLMDTGTLGPLTYSWGLREWAGSTWDVVAEVRDHFAVALGRHRWGIPDLTLYLDVPSETAAERATSAPGTHPTGLIERHRRVAARERELWSRRFPRILSGRFERVDARPPAPAVARAILGRLRDPHRSTAGRPVEAARLLASFRASPLSYGGTTRAGNR